MINYAFNYIVFVKFKIREIPSHYAAVEKKNCRGRATLSNYFDECGVMAKCAGREIGDRFRVRIEIVTITFTPLKKV